MFLAHVNIGSHLRGSDAVVSHFPDGLKQIPMGMKRPMGTDGPLVNLGDSSEPPERPWKDGAKIANCESS